MSITSDYRGTLKSARALQAGRVSLPVSENRLTKWPSAHAPKTSFYPRTVLNVHRPYATTAIGGSLNRNRHRGARFPRLDPGQGQVGMRQQEASTMMEPLLAHFRSPSAPRNVPPTITEQRYQSLPNPPAGPIRTSCKTPPLPTRATSAASTKPNRQCDNPTATYRAQPCKSWAQHRTPPHNRECDWTP